MSGNGQSMPKALYYVRASGLGHGGGGGDGLHLE